MEIIKKYDSWLATGHLSPEESVLLCREGRNAHVNMILTHPEWDRTKIPGSIQAELADLGVLIEKNWLNLAEGSVSPEEMAQNIRLAGVHSVYLATDRGQYAAEHPAQAMLLFIETILSLRFTPKEIRQMTKETPERIVKQ